MSLSRMLPGSIRSPPASSAHSLISWCFRRSRGMRHRISEVIQVKVNSFGRNKEMGLLNSLLGGDDWRDKPKEEKQADIGRYRAVREANEASGRHIREEGPSYYLFQEAIADAEQHVPWWRR